MSYTVTIQPDAAAELDEIYAYIALELKNLLDAGRVVGRLENAILELSDMPYRAPLARDPRFAIQGVRTLTVGNYIVYYIVDDVVAEVSIVHVAHHLRSTTRRSR